MSAGEVLGVAVCALCAALFSALVKRGGREYAILLSTGAAVLIVAFAVKSMAPLIGEAADLAGDGPLPALCLAVMGKAVGLTVLGQVTSRLCKDAGESALAYGVELAARTAVLAAAMPLAVRLLECLREILG